MMFLEHVSAHVPALLALSIPQHGAACNNMYSTRLQHHVGDAAEGERCDEQRDDRRPGRAASVRAVVSLAAAGTWLRQAPTLFAHDYSRAQLQRRKQRQHSAHGRANTGLDL